MLFNPSVMTLMAQARLRRETLPAAPDHKALDAFVAEISRAVGFAMGRWQAQAALVDVAINGPVAFGGRLVGPPLDALIRSLGPAGWDSYTGAISAALNEQMKFFERDVKVPGMPWYPSFAAMPAPMAPPTPNVPCPLMSIAASAVHHFTAAAIKKAIEVHYGAKKPAGGDAVATAVADGFEKAALAWVAGTMVQQVLGTGPVPAFAPPYVPVGSVVNGSARMLPGGLI